MENARGLSLDAVSVTDDLHIYEENALGNVSLRAVLVDLHTSEDVPLPGECQL